MTELETKARIAYDAWVHKCAMDRVAHDKAIPMNAAMIHSAQSEFVRAMIDLGAACC